MQVTLRVNVFGQLKRIWVGQVSVSGRDSQNKTVFLTDVLHDYVSYLVLYVCRLVSHRYFGDARQVHESQVQHFKHRNKHMQVTAIPDIWYLVDGLWVTQKSKLRYHEVSKSWGWWEQERCLYLILWACVSLTQFPCGYHRNLWTSFPCSGRIPRILEGYTVSKRNIKQAQRHQ